MSIAVMSKVWSMPLDGIKKLVLLALADFANDEGLCWPSYQRLSEKCSISRRHAMRIMTFFIDKELVSKKELAPTSRFKRSNLYQINIQNLLYYVPDGDHMSPLNDTFDEDDGDAMSLSDDIDGDTRSLSDSDTRSLGGDTRSLIIRTIKEPPVRTITKLEKDKSFSNCETSVSRDEETEQILKKKKPDKCPYQDIVNLYHQHLPTLPTVQILSKARKASIKSRWNEHPSLDIFEDFFLEASESKFLLGKVCDKEGNNFIANIDFLMRPKVFVKVIEGFYTR